MTMLFISKLHMQHQNSLYHVELLNMLVTGTRTTSDAGQYNWLIRAIQWPNQSSICWVTQQKSILALISFAFIFCPHCNILLTTA